MTQPLLLPHADFLAAARATLTFLHDRLGFARWVLTRSDEGAWVVLVTLARADAFGIREGDGIVWMDSTFSRMMLGPSEPPPPSDKPRTAALASRMSVGAFVGAPILRPDGGEFGYLAALDPVGAAEPGTPDDALISTLARMLATVLDQELRAAEEKRRAERAQLEAMVDELTGLWNRRAWESLKAKEEARCRRYGNPACVLSIDLDGLKQVNDTLGHGAGDDLIRRAAQAIKKSTRSQDVVARLGGDEFGVLAVECDHKAADELAARLQESLAANKVAASVGLAPRRSSTSLDAAWDEADAAMYRVKMVRRRSLPRGAPG